MALHILRVIVLEIPVMATVEIHENRHDLAQGQGRLADTLALAIVEQTLRVERLKPLAKVIDFAEHSNESTHRDLRMVQAASWRTQPPYVGPVVVSSPRAYPELRFFRYELGDERVAAIVRRRWRRYDGEDQRRGSSSQWGRVTTKPWAGRHRASPRCPGCDAAERADGRVPLPDGGTMDFANDHETTTYTMLQQVLQN